MSLDTRIGLLVSFLLLIRTLFPVSLVFGFTDMAIDVPRVLFSSTFQKEKTNQEEKTAEQDQSAEST